RAVEAPEDAPPRIEIVVARPPFSVESERELFASLKVDTLVARAGGGPSGLAKIEAARDLKMEIVLIRRPAPEPGERARTVERALEWIEARLSI
ncbi:MAG: precorrin-6A/cobalt-precorrin-6A reductase, partial [Alphaproteobacteria bacterium]|nr:precorrin-6A/cobalt-precorrin-6A reductase [Alphaproteobacteria bacterium]